MHTAGCSKRKNLTRTGASLISCLMIGFACPGAPLLPGQLDPDYRPRFERTGGLFRLHPAANGAFLVELDPKDVRLNYAETRRLGRMQADGTLITGFSSPTFLDSPYFSQVLPQPDGRIWIEYYAATPITPRPPVRFVRLNADGTKDETFHLPVVTDEEDWRLLAIQPDGKVLAALKRPAALLADRYKLLRLQTDGSIDPSFVSAVDEGAYIRSAQLLPDGRAVAEFTPTAFGEGAVSDFMRLRSDGSRDDTFTPQAPPNLASYTFHAVSPGGEILIVNYAPQGAAQTFLNFVRLRPDGSLDPDFHPDIIPSSIIGLLPDGEILVRTLLDTGRIVIDRLNHDGSLAENLTLDVFEASGLQYSFDPLPNSQYLVQDGYHAWVYSAQGVRLNPVNVVVHQAVKPPVPVAFADGSLLFGRPGATFDAVNHVSLTGPALLDAAGKLDPLFTAWFQGQANWLPVQAVNGEVYVCDAASRLFTSVSRDGALRQLGSRGNNFSPTSGQRLQFQSDLSLVTADGSIIQHIQPDARVASTQPIVGPSDEFRGFKLLPDDSLLVWGAAQAFEGMPGNGVGRLKPDFRRPDSEFHPALPFGAEGLLAEPQPDGKVLVFYDTHLRSQPARRYRLDRLNLDGSRDPHFYKGLSFDGLVKAVQLDSQGRILVAGAFHTVGQQQRNCLVRLLPDGTPDPGFDSGDGPDAPIENLFVLPGDALVLHGDFRHFNGEECWGLVKLPAVPAFNAAPHILSLSVPRTVRAGDNLTLGAVVAGVPAIQSQWFHNEIALTGETNSTLTLRHVNGDSEGSYSLFAGNSEGAETASTSLTVVPAVAEPPALALLRGQGNSTSGFTMGLVAEPTNRYRLQMSTNLTVWRNVTTVIDPNTSGRFNDPFGAVPGPRFARAVQQ